MFTVSTPGFLSFGTFERFLKKLGLGGLGLDLGVAKVHLPAHWCIYSGSIQVFVYI